MPEDFIAYLRKMEESESGRAVREATYRAVEAAAKISAHCPRAERKNESECDR